MAKNLNRFSICLSVNTLKSIIITDPHTILTGFQMAKGDFPDRSDLRLLKAVAPD